MRVLVVDDDEDQLALRCTILQKNGFETLQATDAATALKLTVESRPDCAIVDLLLPTEEAGFALLKKLRALDSGMRLVVLTGMRRDSVADRVKAASDEVLEKSSGTAAWVSGLKRLLRNN